MPETLSPRQQQVLDFLRRSIRERGYVPSIREIGEALSLQSTSTIHYHLTMLAERGLIRWDKGKNRAIQLVSSGPEPAALDAPPEPRGLPLVGRIVAGSPIEAIGDGTERVDLEAFWGGEQNFLLQVKGESMIEDHIAPGDLVVVKPQATARDGEIVVALLDNGEATLKRYFREKGRHRLQPANAAMDPIYVDRVAIQGKVIGVIRQVR